MKRKKARDNMTESEAIREKRKFAIELKQLVHQNVLKSITMLAVVTVCLVICRLQMYRKI